jgi:hypothetical protein
VRGPPAVRLFGFGQFFGGQASQRNGFHGSI